MTLSRQLKYPNFQFAQGDIRHTDFEDGFFDAIVAISTIEHVGILDGDRQGDVKAIKEMTRILAKEGVMLITIPYGKEQTIDNFQKVYDEKAVNDLFADMIIEKFEVFEQDREGFWVKESNAISHLNLKRTTAVALMKVKSHLRNARDV